MKKTDILIMLMIIASLIIAAYAYQVIETEKIASHWNKEGQVDGYMSKFWGLFLIPIILITIYLLFLAIPKVDPLRKNIKKFRRYYDYFIFILILFLFYIFILTILANLGYNVKMDKMLFPAIGLLLIYLGLIMKKLKRNWFIGIRTPWTLSSDKVWEKTHKFGSILFIISGIIIIIGMLFKTYLIFFVLVPIIASVILLVIYSYLEFRKIKK
jgi:uncharacterized membrane protein